MIKLGTKVRDKISGLEGTTIYRTEYLNGCVQYAVMPKMKKGNSEMPSWMIDEEQLEIIGKKAEIKKRDIGGPSFKIDRKEGYYARNT